MSRAVTWNPTFHIHLGLGQLRETRNTWSIRIISRILEYLIRFPEVNL